jgi:hypothetical protein
MKERLSKKWTSPIYAIYHPTPTIEVVDGRRAHVFACTVKACKYKCRRKGDAFSTGNLRRHVKSCWGEEALNAAESASDVKEAREKVVKPLLRSGSIDMLFERQAKGKVTYSNRQHTKVETRTEIVRWVAESLRPFKVVADRGFQCLMKTGQPNYYLPSPMTVSRDVKKVFARTRNRIAKMLQVCLSKINQYESSNFALQEYKGKLNFATDCWTSPNHHAFIAITVHLEFNGTPMCIPLDVVEVARSHSGLALAQEFAWILEEFTIEHKVSIKNR